MSDTISTPAKRKITKAQLKKILADHKKWLEDSTKGKRADLSNCDLSGHDMRGARLDNASLDNASLQYASLDNASLDNASLYNASLDNARLDNASGLELAIARTRILPEGDIIGWKKCRDGVIVKLRIPAAAKRSHALGRKCRAEYAVVLEIYGGGGEATSRHDSTTIYRVGETIKPHSFDPDWRNECAGGIHFFITREEAEDY